MSAQRTIINWAPREFGRHGVCVGLINNKMVSYYKKKTKEELEDIVAKSETWSDVMRKLGYTANRGNSFLGLKKYIDKMGINYSHFKGRAHGRSINRKYLLSDIFCKDSKYVNMSKLKQYAIKYMNLGNKCCICGLSEWMGKPITLQLHHINGDNRDNRIENLQLLCPNCHSQTDSFCKKSN